MRPRILAGLFAVLLVLGTVPKARSLGSPDFKVFYTAARHLVTDPENLYKVSPDRYLYPPSTAFLLLPFAFSTHYVLHQWLWHGFLGLLLFALASTSFAALGAFALLFRYLIITFMYGQINLPVLALLALTANRLQAGYAKGAGSLWALASSLKVYPLVLAPLFLDRKHWRAWIGAGCAGALLLFLPFAFLGAGLSWELYGEFFAALRAKGLPLYSHNQSLAAFFLRVCTDQEFSLHSVGPTHWGLVQWPEGAARALAWSFGGALALASWWRAWQRGLRADTALSAAAFTLLFLSHIVWKDYFLFLYFPLQELFSRWPRKQALLLAGAFAALVTFSSPDVLGAPLAARLDAACIHLWAATLVWGAWWKK